MVDQSDDEVSLPISLASGRTGRVVFDPNTALHGRGDGSLTPSTFTYIEESGDDRPAWAITCVIDDDGRSHVDEVRVRRAEGGRDLHRDDLVKLRDIQQVADEITRSLAVRSNRWPRGDDISPLILMYFEPLDTDDLRGLRKRTRRTVDDEFLRSVAEIYRSNEDRGAPVQAIVQALRCSETSAFRYVRLARERGLLSPRSKG
jgi:hypothetical protein